MQEPLCGQSRQQEQIEPFSAQLVERCYKDEHFYAVDYIKGDGDMGHPKLQDDLRRLFAPPSVAEAGQEK